MIIENGTGVAGADSFVTGAEYIAFTAAFYDETVTANEPALRRAFAHMRSLDWIDNAFPTFGGTIPQAVKDAQSIFARAEAANVGALAPSVTAGQSKVLVGVDSLQWQVTGSGGVHAQRQTVLAALDMLKGLIRSGGAVTYLDRG